MIEDYDIEFYLKQIRKGIVIFEAEKCLEILEEIEKRLDEWKNMRNFLKYFNNRYEVS